MAKPDPDRDARLAAALRDNLRRRKSQTRESTLDQARPASANQNCEDSQAAEE